MENKIVDIVDALINVSDQNDSFADAELDSI
jgi:hypothetical protein